MLKFYYSGAPNPTKVALFLEETGTPYEPIPIDTRKGEQHKPEFLAINPNAKLPAIVDGDVKVFDSSAILLYLAEKTGKFLPAKTDKARGELLSWMFFVASGVGPYFGQSVHFRVYAPEKISYAANRYAFEAQRHAGILDASFKAEIHDRQHLYDRRHECVGLGAAYSNCTRRWRLGEVSEFETIG
jgi:GSH-dependent disulfide-bond oxidoreductase